ncbi:hypothetical protein M0R45_004123 [Rubus argutus]|uniref:AAA-type ATPase N-terminal domain-containing protein n=1 Tax=Rubus argutus TaxID=59490 RepID=A0AAW1YIV5_RUBAR
MFASNPAGMPTTASTLFSAYASFAAAMMLVRSITDQFIPEPLRTYISSFLRCLFTPLSTNLTLVIEEYAGLFQRNQVYDAAELYLSAKISPLTKRLRVRKTLEQTAISSNIDKNQELVDTFENIKLKWKFVSVETRNGGQNFYTHHYDLSFHKKHKDRVMECYLPYVLAKAKAIKEEQKILKLYSLNGGKGSWESINLEHPSTFETLAMEPEMKKMLIGDLDRFLRRREFYKKVGKAWKRGYLLWSAWPCCLPESVYYRVEDIDCSVELQNREAAEERASQYNKSKKMMTLRGLLNSIDGLWSSSGTSGVYSRRKKVERMKQRRRGIMKVEIQENNGAENGAKC